MRTYSPLIILLVVPAIFSAEPAYISKLSSPKPEERRQALEAARTGMMKSFDVAADKQIPAPDSAYAVAIKRALIPLLDDPESDVQSTTLSILALAHDIPGVDIEKKVFSLLQSKSEDVRSEAIFFLAQLRYYTELRTPRAEVSAAFFTALSDPAEKVRVKALSDILAFHPANDKLVDALGRNLKNPSDNEKVSAIYALALCRDVPAETMTAIFNERANNSPIMTEIFTHLGPVLMKKTGRQRWHNGILVRDNPYGLGRAWFEIDRPLIGKPSCGLVLSANGHNPTQYTPVPEGQKDRPIPVDAFWMPSGDALAVIFPGDEPDIVVMFNKHSWRNAAESPNVQYIEPKQRPLTEAERQDLKLGTKAEYLKAVSERRAKRGLQRRFTLWPSGKTQSDWSVYEKDDGSYNVHGPYGVWFESGKLKELGNYIDGKLDGALQEWDENGKVIADGIWKDSKPVSGTCRDTTDKFSVKEFVDGTAKTPK